MASKDLIETPSRLEPCLIDEARGELLDLVAALPAAASALGGRLHPQTAASLARLVRVMNCYYSNLIEGHNTRPRDIERAMNDDFDADEGRRNLQIEARAHIRVQTTIDDEAAAGTPPEPTRAAFILGLHRAFYEGAPDAMLRIEGAGRVHVMVPGVTRSTPDEEVAVGRHLPPSGPVVASFLDHFAERYRFDRKGPAARLLAIPAAHHRLNYIHPFLDGNGRVSRLMSHAMCHAAGIGAQGLWSVSRGLARGLEGRGDYRRMMDYANTPRRGDLDGRGNLSLRALEEFSVWFLKVCLDQIRFMTEMFELDGLAARLRRHAEKVGLRPEAAALLVEILHRGSVQRGDAATITGLGERAARTVLGNVIARGLLGSTTEKGPVSLRFPMAAVEDLFPRLFPET